MARSDVATLYENRFLSVLPRDTLEQLLPYAEVVQFERGDLVLAAGQPIDKCYFPTGGMISLLLTMSGGDQVEVAYVGREGFVGFLTLFGKKNILYEALAQSSSKCIAIRSDQIRRLFDSSNAFREVMLRFVYFMMRQFTQTCACNQFHTIDARLCRWLVAIAERSQSKRLDLTQEFLARILGVQRTSIGPAATELREAGIIRYSRGVIEILDEERLKARACECYSIVDAEQKELLSEQSHIRAA